MESSVVFLELMLFVNWNIAQSFRVFMSLFCLAFKIIGYSKNKNLEPTRLSVYIIWALFSSYSFNVLSQKYGNWRRDVDRSRQRTNYSRYPPRHFSASRLSLIVTDPRHLRDGLHNSSASIGLWRESSCGGWRVEPILGRYFTCVGITF